MWVASKWFHDKKDGLTREKLRGNVTVMKQTDKGLSSQSYGFSISNVWMSELDCEESWVPKNQCFWTVVLEKTLESPLDSKEIQPVHPKGNQSWIFIGRTDAEAETPRLWPPDADSLEKPLMLGKIEGRRRKGWQRMRWLGGWCSGQAFEQAPGVADGQGRPGRLQSMESQRVGHNWATKLNWAPTT